MCVYLQEMSLGIYYNVGGYDLFSYIKDFLIWDVKDGYVQLMKGFGLGIELDEDFICKVSKDVVLWVLFGFVGFGGEL